MPDVGATQRDSQKFIVFTAWEKMNTRLARVALPENQLAWQENLQPIGENNLVPVPAAVTFLTALSVPVKALFFANIGSVDYLIDFPTDGSANAINLATGAAVGIATAGTFSAPDVTVYASQRILIADPTAGYSTWDGTTFVKGGGVSPNFNITNVGTGYTSAPTVAISGGHGTGATATATVSGGFVVAIQLTNAGTGYQAGDTLSVAFSGGGGTGAAATVKVWPATACYTLAVFAGRVWTANGRTMQFTGTAGYDDVNPANAAGSVTFADADLSHKITALRTLNNYLFIFGDQSVRQIGSITVSGNITLFTPFVLASDIGTSFKDTILSYNRLVLFANKNGAYAIFGASVEKISDDLDGIFAGPTVGGTVHSHIDFSQTPVAALQDLRNIHCYMLLVKYFDSLIGTTRQIILVFQEKNWFIVSQGSLIAMCATFTQSAQQWDTFASSGTDITQILQDTTTAVPITLRTALSPHGNPIQAKQALRAGVGCVTNSQQVLTLTVESEYTTRVYNQLVLPVDFFWVNNQDQIVTWVNSTNGVVQWMGAGGFRFPFTSVDGLGKFLGLTLQASLVESVVNMLAIEYQDRALWGRPA